MRKPRTLFSRLLAVFLAFGLLMTGVLVLVMRISHEAYHLEFDQTVNRQLAAQYVGSGLLLDTEAPAAADLARGLARIAAANPGIDAYVLDGSGRVLAASRPEPVLAGVTVDTKPVAAFLSGTAALPILGDDPRGPGERDIFSAAPLRVPGTAAEILYIVLHRHSHDDGVRRLGTSYAVNEGAGVLVAAAVLAVLASIAMLRLLTRRLARLESSMQAFRDGNFERAPPPLLEGAEPRDEIERLGVLFDELARRMQAQVADLRRTDESRREFLANLSHDLRTPLAALEAHLEALTDDAHPVAAEERGEYLRTARRQAARLRRLIEQLLQLARLDAQQVELRAEPFPLADLAHEVAAKFAIAAERQGLRIELDAPAALPWVCGDVGLLERVLDNLVGNALRHARARVRLRLAVVGGGVEVRVTDDGSGVNPADSPKIFERFYRVDPSRSADRGGTGLGLAIARSILALHGSDIAVRRAEEGGAEFAFVLAAAGEPSLRQAGPPA